MLDVKISGFYDEQGGKLDDQIAMLQKLGEHYMCPRNIDGKNISAYTAEEFAKNIKPRLDKAGIKFSSIGSPIGKVGINDEEGYQKQLKQLEELIKIAEMMDCKYIRIFSFQFTKDQDPDKFRDIVMAKMAGFLKLVEGHNVVLMHENEKHIYGDIARRCLDLYNTFKDKGLVLVYDASNFIQVGDDPKKAFDLLKDYVVYYHIKDCDNESKVEVPVGLGDGNYEYIISELSKRNYQGFMTMEPHTFKYAILRQIVYFVPFMPLFMNKYFKVFRKVDKSLGNSVFKKISIKDVYELQHSRLKALIANK